MLQNEVLKNERFIGALSRSAQNTVVPFVNLRVASHFFFFVVPTAKYIPVGSRAKKWKRVISSEIIPLMNNGIK